MSIGNLSNLIGHMNVMCVDWLEGDTAYINYFTFTIPSYYLMENMEKKLYLLENEAHSNLLSVDSAGF